jgi:hypothetical protein
MIPETKLNAVKKALQSTFGVSEYGDIKQLTAGLTSTLVYRVVVKDKPYLLRIITRDDLAADRIRQYNCMKAAAEAGIAPAVLYMNVEDKISITDFVGVKPFPIDEARAKMPELIRRLHALPPFPKLGNYFGTIDVFIKRFKDAKILPEVWTNEIFHQYERVSNIYPRDDQDMVSCHNDLKPENILYDGVRPWLVDWEAAFLNDRNADLALVSNFLVTNEKQESDYLQAYFGEEPGEYRKARFFLMTQAVHMFYFTVFMHFGSGGKPIDENMMKFDFRDFHNRMWAGQQNLVSAESKLQYAWAHFLQMLNETRTKRFEESLAIVSRHKD